MNPGEGGVIFISGGLETPEEMPFMRKRFGDLCLDCCPGTWTLTSF